MRISTGRDADAMLARHETAGLYQAGAPRPFQGNDGYRAQGEAFTDPIGLIGDHISDHEFRVAIAQAVTEADAEPFAKRRRDEHAIRGEQGVACVPQRERTVERIGAIDAFEFGQNGRWRLTRTLANGLCHCAHADGFAETAQLTKRCLLGPAPVRAASC